MIVRKQKMCCWDCTYTSNLMSTLGNVLEKLGHFPFGKWPHEHKEQPPSVRLYLDIEMAVSTTIYYDKTDVSISFSFL